MVMEMGLALLMTMTMPRGMAMRMRMTIMMIMMVMVMMMMMMMMTTITMAMVIVMVMAMMVIPTLTERIDGGLAACVAATEHGAALSDVRFLTSTDWGMLHRRTLWTWTAGSSRTSWSRTCPPWRSISTAFRSLCGPW